MKISEKMVRGIRFIYFTRYRLLGKKISPCIISRDCIGGVLYKRMGIVFKSPTIKLYMSNEDFILFCLNIKEFIDSSIEECKDTDKTYPVGQITTELGSVKLHFMHYDSFEAAQNSWERRKRRVDFNNIVVILNAGPKVEKELIERFATIPYKKILFSSNVEQTECVKNLSCFENGYDGPLVAYKSSKIKVVRYMDEFDWIGFFKNRN